MENDITRKLNEVYSKDDSSLDPVLNELQALSLPTMDKWRDYTLTRHAGVIGNTGSPITMPEVFGLYAILTDPVVGYETCARAAVAEGVRYLQLRMKGAPRHRIVTVARLIREITDGTDTLFIVNDDPMIAAEVDADGVHLGQSDMSINEARALWDTPGKIFGLSTHNEEQAIVARALKPDYIGVGPVFPTPTKAIPDPDLGLELMGKIIRKSPLPAVAIGGINEENLPEILALGVVNFSSIRPIMQSTDPRAVIHRLMEIWREYGAMKNI